MISRLRFELGITCLVATLLLVCTAAGTCVANTKSYSWGTNTKSPWLGGGDDVQSRVADLCFSHAKWRDVTVTAIHVESTYSTIRVVGTRGNVVTPYNYRPHLSIVYCRVRVQKIKIVTSEAHEVQFYGFGPVQTIRTVTKTQYITRTTSSGTWTEPIY